MAKVTHNKTDTFFVLQDVDFCCYAKFNGRTWELKFIDAIEDYPEVNFLLNSEHPYNKVDAELTQVFSELNQKRLQYKTEKVYFMIKKSPKNYLFFIKDLNRNKVTKAVKRIC